MKIDDRELMQQEPVGKVGWAANRSNTVMTVHWEDECPPIGTKLYTAPQPAQQPLTDEQIESIWDSTLSEDVGITALRKIVRAIEAKLREKNGGQA